MKTLPFTKMHWIWNDFVLLNIQDILNLWIVLNKEFVSKICNRNFWIWSDGLLILDESKVADFKYTMYNPDWSIAEMCGNWIRCFMKYLHDQWITEQNKVSVETGAWILYLELDWDDVVVDMWTPKFDAESIGITQWAKVNDTVISSERAFNYFSVSMWNPHAVIFIEEPVKNFKLHKYGSEIEKNTGIFQNKVNVEFVEVISPTEINFRVYERWAGETLACWTGACWAVAVWVAQWLLEAWVDVCVHLAWWDLYIQWTGRSKDSVIMKWPAVASFSWEYCI